jgi:hypothetical protein
MGKWSKRLLGAGLLAGAAYAVWRALDERSGTGSLEWRAQPFPAPPVAVPLVREAPEPPEPASVPDAEPARDPVPAPDSAWVAPGGDHCPASHPVKAKLASGIFHSPGGQMYDRTVPDRCYRDAAAAVADGLRASKR